MQTVESISTWEATWQDKLPTNHSWWVQKWWLVSEGRRAQLLFSLWCCHMDGWMEDIKKMDGSALPQLLSWPLWVSTSPGWKTVAWWTWFDVVALPKLHTHTCEEKFSLAVMDLVCHRPLAFIITLLLSTIRWMNLATYTRLFNTPFLCSLHNIALLSMSWDSALILP